MGMFPRVTGKEALILDLLDSAPGGELYGLEMVRVSDGDLKRGTVYVTLARMVDRGLVAWRVDESPPPPPGPPRRVYRLTPLSRRLIAASKVASAAVREAEEVPQ